MIRLPIISRTKIFEAIYGQHRLLSMPYWLFRKLSYISWQIQSILSWLVPSCICVNNKFSSSFHRQINVCKPRYSLLTREFYDKIHLIRIGQDVYPALFDTRFDYFGKTKITIRLTRVWMTSMRQLKIYWILWTNYSWVGTTAREKWK